MTKAVFLLNNCWLYVNQMWLNDAEYGFPHCFVLVEKFRELCCCCLCTLIETFNLMHSLPFPHYDYHYYHFYRKPQIISNSISMKWIDLNWIYFNKNLIHMMDCCCQCVLFNFGWLALLCMHHRIIIWIKGGFCSHNMKKWHQQRRMNTIKE